MLHTKAEVLKDSTKVEEGVIDAVVGSTNIIDRMGDVIDQTGWDIKNFLKNPVILWGHNVHEERPPIGKALKVWKGGSSKKNLMFQVKFDLQDTFAAEIFRKIKDGFINTVSVGFLPLEWEELDSRKGPSGGRRYTKQELLELSFVPVPANPEAIVALKGMHDKRFAPVALDKLYPQVDEEVKEEVVEIKEDEVLKPFPNEHACRLKNPDAFEGASFRRMKRKHNGKEYGVIMGKIKGEDTMTDQSFRYGKDVWEASEASAHCKAHKGTFEAAREGQEDIETKEEINLIPKDEVLEETELPKVPEDLVEEKPEKETLVEEKPAEEIVEDKPVEEPKEEVVEEKPEIEEPIDEESPELPEKEEQPEVIKGVISYKDLGTLPESEGWDGPGEEAKAEVTDLKVMCAWYDSANSDNKGAYKLPHHKAEGHKAVWRGVAAAMAALLGARGGVNIPDTDKKGVYNHLKKHYAQFDKEAPEFKMVEEQVLSKLGEEVQALTLDREDKHVVRLVKKVIKEQKEARYTSEQIKKALELLNLALSLYKEDSKKEVSS